MYLHGTAVAASPQPSSAVMDILSRDSLLGFHAVAYVFYVHGWHFECQRLLKKVQEAINYGF
jgi:hypothetical protein